ncbi:type IV pili methyl-accepting chemotaxis transducer N-terminal domain-containing protein [Uruburuella testudinis]|uniref:Sensor protein n=1 Tax=Uruburuella testudinis TaxID=1282863 RepID=A0ABY4DR11_9NEIS|nr:type IV pili methyl-accepting chemotaxis transducer N-terminal domain-containing protein [Uruburuella testudinis]UOO80818.1 type IV pili methyl-accepting chemotaxis transducer N-terminal domain-containing protein [Uruburuella testudinis]
MKPPVINRFGTSLSARLKLLTCLWVGAALFSIAFTLVLSWRLEGAGAAINDAGSLRMRTYRLAYLVNRQAAPATLRAQIHSFEQTMHTIERGDPARPLFLPDKPEVHEKMQAIVNHWYRVIKPLMENGPPDSEQLRQFVSLIDSFVLSVETVNARNTEWLRLFQTALMAMVMMGAGVMVVLLYLWVIRPIDVLRDGMQAIRRGRFGAQVTTGNVAEFAQLGNGFNQMSAHLKTLYTDLEGQVALQTQNLANKNRELETLYQTTRDLHQSHTATTAAEDFLARVLPEIAADAGSVRLLDFDRKRMDLAASSGLPEKLQTAEQCERLEECLCGAAAQKTDEQPVYFFDTHTPQNTATLCEHAGFDDVAVFPIRYKDQELGIFTLYFSDGRKLAPGDTELLHALCDQLGVSIANSRLASENQQLAVLQERNLMAQGLHDSIAQTLTFLNLQVQMLESAVAAGEKEQVAENMRFIKEGVQECYDDVRELLLNFRTKISKKEFPDAVRTLVKRFEQQTQIPVDTDWVGHGMPLSADEQLQVIFILQESLSNIRKHAQAKQVRLKITNEQDFTLNICDNGIGFDTGRLNNLSGEHVGLGIMHERARRIHARLEVQSTPLQGTTITLTLPHQKRTAT